jgi:hypothetical protein
MGGETPFVLTTARVVTSLTRSGEPSGCPGLARASHGGRNPARSLQACITSLPLQSLMSKTYLKSGHFGFAYPYVIVQ